MSSILLTGGSGFIGRYFQEYLAGTPVINLDLEGPRFSCPSSFVQGDIRREDDVRRAIRDRNVKTIVSLAAKHHDFGIGHDEYFDTNRDATATICKVATEENVRDIIFFSSVAVYETREEASTETTDPKPGSPYGASKLAGEKILEAWAKADPERKVLIIRPTLVFGAYNKANMYNLIRQIDSGLYFHLGKGDNIKSIAYVENVVKASWFAYERMKPGVAVYNYADEPQLTSRQISEAIAGELKRKIRITVPKRLGILAGLPFDLLIRLTGKNLPVSSARIRKLGTQTYFSARKIVSEGFVPTCSTTEGLRKMVEWYKENGRTATRQ